MLFRLLLSLIVIFSASSCGSDDILEEPVLNPEEKPKEKPVLVPEKKTDPLDPIDINPGLIESSLQGLLKGLGDDQMFNNNGYRTIWGDTSVDIYSVPDFARDIDLQTYTQLPTYRLFDQAWTQHYFYIGRANEVIKKWGDFALDADNPAVNSKLNELVSTAYYIRAMLYFNLVKIFERPTILSLDTPTTVEDILSAEGTGNATPKQVYDIIIEDLKTVSRIAEDTSNNQTVTKMGAEGLLGRVYLQIAGILNHNFVVDKSIFL